MHLTIVLAKTILWDSSEIIGNINFLPQQQQQQQQQQQSFIVTYEIHSIDK